MPAIVLPHCDAAALRTTLDFLGAHAVPGLERYAGGVFSRVVGGAVVTIAASGPDVLMTGPPAAVPAVAHLLDLDADVAAVAAVLGSDPALAPLVAARPGLRAPGAIDAFETVVRTVIGQQISVSGARTVTGQVVAAYGRPVGDGWRAFPTPQALAAADPQTLPMPRARGRSVVAVARAFADGAIPLGAIPPGATPLDPARDRQAARAALLALPGVGPWTADYVLMRVTHAPDVLLASDLVVRRAAGELGVDLSDGRPGWAPWRSYATHHLWAHLYADVWSAAA